MTASGSDHTTAARTNAAAIAGPYGKVVCRLPPRANVTVAWVTVIRMNAATATTRPSCVGSNPGQHAGCAEANIRGR